MPPIPIAQNEHLGIPGLPGDLEDAQRFDAGTAHPYALGTPHFPELIDQAALSTRK